MGISPDASQEPEVIAVMITSALGVLAGRRHDGKPPWPFIAGRAESRETPSETALREARE